LGLEPGPLRLVRIIEELFEGNSGSGLKENEINGRADPFRRPLGTLYPLKLALTSPTSDGRSVCIFRLQITGHGVYVVFILCLCCPVFRYGPCDEVIIHPWSPTASKIIMKLKNQRPGPKGTVEPVKYFQ
jgi:hypothetical protein